MASFALPGIPLPHIPDDLTVAQFILDATHPLRPTSYAAHPCLIDGETGRRVGFEELRARTFGLANQLKLRYKIGEDNVVCIFSPNHIDWLVASWATHRLGAIVTTANPAFTVEELVNQLAITNTSLIVTHSESLKTALAAAKVVDISPDRVVILDSRPASVPVIHVTIDELIRGGLSKASTFTERRLAPGEGKRKIAFFSFSSGTTGKPKAVAVTHYAVMANILQIRASLSRAPDRHLPGDVVYGVVPLFHAYGLHIYAHLQIWMGGTVVIMKNFVFENFLKTIQQYRVKHLFVVPPICILLAKSPLTQKYDLSSVKWLISGAAPLTEEIVTSLERLIPQSHQAQGYGLTESLACISYPAMDTKLATPGSSGELLPGVVARVIKEDGSLAKPGEAGELYIQSPSLALGYWKNKAATEETFIDGWLRTGDKVIINDKFELFVLERIKELIKVKGFQVAPAELEGHLLTHPDVADVGVIGIPDDFSGELPFAFIVPSQRAAARISEDPEEGGRIKEGLAKYVADHKVAYKKLAGGIQFIDSIPKNPSGKLLRRILRDKVKALPREARQSDTLKVKL